MIDDNPVENEALRAALEIIDQQPVIAQHALLGNAGCLRELLAIAYVEGIVSGTKSTAHALGVHL